VNTSPASVVAAAAADSRGKLTFIKPSQTKPVLHSAAYTGGAPAEFFETEENMVAVHDMRPFSSSLWLDREGFELHQHETAVADLYDDDAVRTVYYCEIQALLRSVTGASRVVIFDATRRSDSGEGAKNPDGLRGPARRVHVDYTARSGLQRVKDLFGQSEAGRLAASGARIMQVNVWRPIRGPVKRSPLALADASSVRPEHLIATDQVFPDRVGEIYHLVHDPSQRWYYAPEMTTGEVLLIKGWDSVDDGRARFTPHAAIDLLTTPADADPRESIEIRAMVVMDA
jgi:hypothetical protein